MDFMELLNSVDSFVWGPPLLILLVGTGIWLTLRLGVLPGAEHVGGLNLFGEKFGDFAQGVVMRVGYAK